MRPSLTCALALVTCALLVPPVQAIGVELISATPSGAAGNGPSGAPGNAFITLINPSRGTLSADGRFVVFASAASDLVAGDVNGTIDVFLRDRATGSTSIVGAGFFTAISPDGARVAYADGSQVYLRDLATSSTQCVSVSSAGMPGNNQSAAFSFHLGGPGLYYTGDVAISEAGHEVVFASRASNLVPEPPASQADVYVHSTRTGRTRRVSIDSNGLPGNGQSGAQHQLGTGWHSTGVAISWDGRIVAFASAASNLAPGDTNARLDVFVHDRETGQTTRVSVDSSGVQAVGGDSRVPGLSADGRFVVFESAATNLSASDTNGTSDVFRHDRVTGETIRVSVGAAGEGNGASGSAAISGDGRRVAFASSASNLFAGDLNSSADIFVRDLLLGTTELVSATPLGVPSSGWSLGPSISGRGRHVAFTSSGGDLAPNDANAAADVFIHD